MLKWLNKIRLYIGLFWHSLFIGMKNAETIIMNSKKTSEDFGIETSDDAGGVFKDILQQKLTQEVKELRYSSYVVANEAKKYKYVGNGEVRKKEITELTEKHGIIDESDNLPVVLIQDCSLICDDVLTVLKEINETKNKKIINDYTLKIKRDLFPRFLIESYVKKIVVKDAIENYVIDLYCSKYPKQFSEKKDRAFLSELKRIKNREVKNSDVLDFLELSFVTSNAWGIDDYYRFTFNDFEFYDILEFDGNYIVRLGCKSNNFMENLLDKIYCETADEKYKKKERRNGVINFIEFKSNKYTNTDEKETELFENVKFSVENND